MIKMILLDLDNTLIDNPDREFASHYLGLLDAHLRNTIGYSDGKASMRRAMWHLKNGRDMVRTNADVIIDQFVQDTLCTPDVIQVVLNQFYEQHYPQLESLIKPIKEPNRLLSYLFDSEFSVVLATNPIYPLNAIQQRLVWGGLDVEVSQFAFVTHSENMHSIKPDPAYYAETIARVGVEPDQAIMIGNSETNDIIPAKVIGLSTFHVSLDDTSPSGYRGNLAQFEQLLLDPSQLGQMRAEPLQPPMIVPQYRGNVGALWGMLIDVKPHFWHQYPYPDEWSIIQILCHISEREREHHLPTLERIRSENNPFIVSPAPPGPHLVVCDEDGMRVAREYTAAREETLKVIQSFHLDEWQRPARHSIFGLTNLLEMAYFIAQHDRLHLNQLCQTLGKCE